MPGYSQNRIEIFSDAVIAIALTLLVLELHPPEIPDHSSTAEYLVAMAPLWPKIASFVLGFVTICIHWVNHHYFFSHIGKPTIQLVWLNNLFLLGISFLPFPTAMLGDHPTDQFPVLLFAVSSLLLALTFLALRTYAVRAQLFANTDYHQTMGPKQSLPAVGLYALSALLALVSPGLSLISLAMVPVLYFAPTIVQSLRQKRSRLAS